MKIIQRYFLLFLYENLRCDSSLKLFNKKTLMRDHNICLNREISKNISGLSSNTQFFWAHDSIIAVSACYSSVILAYLFVCVLHPANR